MFIFIFILKMKDGVAKIGGMGISKSRNRLQNIFTRTPEFMAPEVLQDRKYSLPADIYSFAITVWEMWYGRRVYSDNEFNGAMSYLFLRVSEK